MLRRKQPLVSPLGRLIQTRRRELGVSLRELERRSGIAHIILSRLERGQREGLSLRLVDPLADALGVTVNEVLAALGLPADRQLPPLPTYLRVRYGTHLSPDAEAEMRHYLREFQLRHGITNWFPTDRQDETTQGHARHKQSGGQNGVAT